MLVLLLWLSISILQVFATDAVITAMMLTVTNRSIVVINTNKMVVNCYC